MDKEQGELQFLGFLGIFKESFKIIFKWPKIFMKISLAFILPLSCISLANLEFTKFLSNQMLSNSATLVDTQAGSPDYNKVSGVISRELFMFWLIKITSLVLGLVLSLFSVSAVVYTIACIYTGKDFSFKKVVSVVPKVWKRLMITFLCNLGIIFAYTFVFVFVIMVISMIVIFSTSTSKLVEHQVGITTFFVLLFIVFLVGVLYMTVIWQLANVISVMEKYCGFKAMKRSRELIKGKMGCAIAIMFVLGLCYVPQQLLVQHLVRDNSAKIWYGMLCVVYNTVLMLYGLVVQAVFYFVCKSYHHENIDKSSLADHLEAFHEDYIPLKNEVQL